MTIESLEDRIVLAADVVISEIMYHPASENPLDEFIEIYNRGDEAAILQDWKFTAGVDFVFPSAALPAGQSLVVAANLARFQSQHPGITNVVAGWTGELSNSGERIKLVDDTGASRDEVTYADEGDWALRRRGPLDLGHQGWDWIAQHDGLGASLELINPAQSNNNGQNWASSGVTGGTPGLANSVTSTDIAPIVSDVTHSPIVPRTGQAVTIRAEIDDELNTGIVAAVRYRLDGAPTFSEAPMFDDGAHNDGLAGDGVYTGELPGQANGAVVEFYVRAVDAAAHVRTWPAPTSDVGDQEANALYQVDDTITAGNQPFYRLIMKEADRAELAQIGASTAENDSNAAMNATFVATVGDDVEARYNVSQRLRGASSRDYAVKSYRINIPTDRTWQGVSAINLNAREIISQIAGSAIFAAAGLPDATATLVQVRVNGADLSGGVGYAHLEVVDSDFADAHFGDDSNGNLYSKRRPDNKWAYRNNNPTAYRNDGWEKDSNSSTNDWSDLDQLLNALNNAPNDTYLQTISQKVNIDQWVRWFALMTLLGNNETNPSNGADDDYAMYRGVTDPRFILLPHDLDSILGFQGSSPTSGLFRMLNENGGLTQLTRFFNTPEIASKYYAQLRELATTVLSAEQLGPLLQNLLGGLTSQATINGMLAYMAARNAYVLSQIPSQLSLTSPLPVSNGFPTTTEATTSLSGVAPVEGTRRVLVDGHAVLYNPQTGTWTSSLPDVISENIMPAQSSWKYNDSGADLGTAWRASAYDDSAWHVGNAQLGFGDGDEATLLNCGPSAPTCTSNNIPTYYFRRTFNVTNASRYTGMTFRILRDDGAAVYLNGVEVVRDNLPADATAGQFALAGTASETQFYEFFVPISMLHDGDNVLAVEVHQNAATSTDVSFDMAIEGLLVNVATTTLLPASATGWKYLANGVNQGTAWIAPAFNDTAWPTGRAQLGYGDGDENTVIPCGPSAGCNSNNYPTVYFRRTFEVADASKVVTLRLRLLRDDGAAVYINGVEVARSNLGSGATYSTFAQAVVNDPAEDAFFDFTLDPRVLVNGTNVVAVEVHQQSASSSDVSFDLELIGQTLTGTSTAGGVDLLPGINHVLVQAIGANNQEIARNTIDIWYDDGTAPVYSGILTGNNVWTAANGPHRISGSLTLPGTATLTIEPGATVFFNPGATMTVNGRLTAIGTDSKHIRFMGLPTAVGTWNGIAFNSTSQINRLAYVDIEGADGNDWLRIGTNAKLDVDHTNFGMATRPVAVNNGGSLTIRDSNFAGGGSGILIRGTGISATGKFIIERNTFAARPGGDAFIDYTTAKRPAAIVEVRGNTFAGNGSASPAIVLRGADAHLEGNIFSGFIAGAIVARANATSVPSEITLARNVIANGGTGVALLEGSRLTSQNNTYANNSVAIGFGAVGVPVPGAGASLAGDIVVGGSTFFGAVTNHPTYGTTQLSVSNSLVPNAATAALGTGNVLGDPRFLSAVDFHLRAGSAAAGVGPDGRDAGAYVAAGAAIYGEPASITSSNAAALTVGGAGIVSYLYKLDGGAYSAETPVGTPIVLSGLANGPHSVQVVGRDSSGVLQADAAATLSRTWTVNTALAQVTLSEVLASNSAAYTHEGTTPDVIELYNPSATTVDLSGMFLTDDPLFPTRFAFPAGTTLAAGEYLLVYADSATATTTGLHAGFNLSANGDGVYLIGANQQIIDQVVFGAQALNYSIAKLPSGNWSLAQPTLGTANRAQATGDNTKVVINEWLAREDRLLDDDFIELYNPDSLPVAISGLALTDSLYAQPRKHVIAPLSFIAPTGLTVFQADGSTESGADHLDFSLSTWQETLALTDATGKPLNTVVYGPQSSDVSQGRGPDGNPLFDYFLAPSPGLANPDLQASLQAVVPIDAVWRYNDSGANQGTAWRGVDFNDTLWPSGRGLLYAENDPLPGTKNTPLNTGTPTHYFRTEFDGSALPSAAEIVNLGLIVDDGAIVYLNGVEIFRVGMGSGAVSHTTFASRSVSNAVLEGPFALPKSLFLPGRNVIAVEVHQDDASSSDVVMGLSLDAVIPPVDARTTNTLELLDHLRISEIHYNGTAGSTTEFVELINTGDATLNLEGVRFTAGVDYTFGAVTLAPGERIVIAQDVELFNTLYGPGLNVVGNFGGTLSNGGEEITLRLPQPLEGKIEEFTYDDGWYPSTDGGGYSLVVVDVNGDPDALNDAAGWRPSYFVGGSPGSDDAGQVVINEISANSTGASADWIELRNTTDRDLDVSGWYVTDTLGTPHKYRIPDGTILAGASYLVLNEASTFGSSNAAAQFALPGGGGSLYLLSADVAGELTGYVETAIYGAAEPNRTIGRYSPTDGGADLVRMNSATKGSENSQPVVGPVVISELMYNPTAGGDEFIELRNTTAAAIPLHQVLPSGPHAWQLTGAVNFTFPAGAVLPAGGLVLIVAGDPAAYRTAHNVPAEVAIFGPYTGDLGNDGDDVRLLMPEAVDVPAPAMLLIDRVAYGDDTPWPRFADGRGSSIIRTSDSEYGNDSVSWQAGNVGGTPGRVNAPLDVTPPSTPTGVIATVVNATRVDISWTAATDAESGISLYRVFRNNALIGASATTTFSDTTAVAGQTYAYTVAAVNNDTLVGAASTPANITTLGISNAGTLDTTHVVVVFSEPVTSGSSQNAANYTIAGATISTATRTADGRTVTLITSPLNPGQTYTLTVSGIVGTSGNQLPSGVSATFRAATAGFTVRDVKAIPGQGFSNLATAEAFLALPAGSSAIAGETTAIIPFIDLTDPDSGYSGHFNSNRAFPNGTAGVDDDGFAVRATGQFFMPPELAGAWTIGTRNDDGLRVTIDGADALVDPFGHGANDRYVTLNLSAGFHTVVVSYYDTVQNSMVELFAAAGTYTDFSQTSAWRLIGDVANGGLAATTIPTTAAPPSTSDWQRVEPAGSMAFEYKATGATSANGAPQDFKVNLLAGQTLSLFVTSAANATMYVGVALNGEDFIAAIGAPGAPANLRNLPITETGEYTIRAGSPEGGAFTLRAVVNADVEYVGAGGQAQQVATSIIDFSSEYSSTSWSAAQVLGPPDTFVYGDVDTSWAPRNSNGAIEYLTVGYSIPVYATAAVVRETNGNGFVTKIEALDLAGEYHVVWEGTDTSQPGAPANFAATFPQTSYLVKGLRVSIDTDHDQSTWEEVDAIILVGAQAGAAANDTVATAIPLTVGAIDLSGGFGGPVQRMSILGATQGNASDYYSLSLAAGENLSVVVGSPGSPAINLDMLDSVGNVVAVGVRHALDVDLSIGGFTAPADGVYYLRVNGPVENPYSLTALRGASFAVEPNNDIATAIDVTRSGVGVGYVGKGAVGSGEPGPGAMVSLGVNLTDGEGFLWDISQSGAINDGTNDAYDTGMQNQVFNGASSARYENNNREISIGPGTNNPGISITRKIFVPNNQGYARFLEIITNTGSTSRSFEVPIFTNLGSDGTNGELVTTSTGDATFTTEDDWILTDDADGSNDPSVLHVVAGPGGQRPSHVEATGGGSVGYSYQLQLAPGETKIIMHFAAQSTNRAIARTKAEDLVKLQRDALAGMTAEELAQVVNFRPADSVDEYTVWAEAGDVLTIDTTTPEIGFEPYGFNTGGPTGTNSLDPRVELVDVFGNLLSSDDNTAVDGRNAHLMFTVTTAGQYRVRLLATAGSGEYALHVSGATGTAPAASVVSTSPTNGAALRPNEFPTTITIDLSDAVAPGSVNATDLLVNGTPASAVELVDGNTLRFTVPSSIAPLEKQYTLSVAAGALTTLSGAVTSEYTGSFVVDGTAPRIIAALFNSDRYRQPPRYDVGGFDVRLGFSENVHLNSSFSGVSVYEANREESFLPDNLALDAENNYLTANWGSLREGQYTFYVFSEYFADVVGLTLDGEPAGRFPDGTTTGNGTAGGAYSRQFVVDADLHSLDAVWQRPGALGSLAMAANVAGNVTFAGDMDAFDFDVAAGEVVGATIRPLAPVTLTVRLVDGQGNAVFTTTSAAAGDAVTIPVQAVANAGRYRVEVTGDTAGVDYNVTVSRNAAVELGDSQNPSPQSISSTHSTVSGSRWSVVGNASPHTLGTYTETLSKVNSVAFPNQLDFTFPATGLPRGDATLKIDAQAYLDGPTSFLSIFAEGYHLGDVFVEDGEAFSLSSTSMTIPESVLSKIAADGHIDLRVTPSQNVFNIGNTFIELTLTYQTTDLVWGVRPAQGDIALVDAASGAVLRTIPAPSGLAAGQTKIGLTSADNGASLLYVNADVASTTLFRLDASTGAVLSTSTLPGGNYDGLGFDSNFSRVTIYSANMDTNPGWTLNGQWAYGIPTGQGEDSQDPTAGHTGQNVIGFNLNGSYPASMSSTIYARTAAIDTRGKTNVELSFWRWLGVEDPDYDHATIDVSNNGSTWTSVYANAASVFDNTWVQQTFDISEVADNQATVYVRWGMGPTDSSVNYAGWNIDDVLITGDTAADPKIFLSERDAQLLRQEGFNGAVTGQWATGAPRGGVAGDGTGRLFAYFADGFIHEIDTDSDTNAFVGAPITSPAADVEGLAFDGKWLYVSTASGKLFAVDPTSSQVISQSTVAGGGIYGLAANAKPGEQAPFALVPAGSAWKYFDQGQSLGTEWRASNYADAAWASGNARLGYSPNAEDGEVTTVSYGPNASNKYPTTYFRKHFSVSDPAAIASLLLELVRDDGAAVYLNGTEVARSNLAANATYNSFATATVGASAEQQFFTFDVNPALLVAGDNVLAVEVHQADATSTDMGFNLRLTATPRDLTAPDIDVYTIDWSAFTGKRVEITLSPVGTANFSTAKLELLDPAGNVVATGTGAPLGPNATNYAQGILGFQIPSAGVYSLRVTTRTTGQYVLNVAESMLIESEPNSLPTDVIRALGNEATVAGYLSGQDIADNYTINLTAGQRVRLSTSTPLSQFGGLVNGLNSRIALFNSSNVQVMSSTSSVQGGVNGALDFIAETTGTLRVAVQWEAGAGEYVLSSSVSDPAALRVADIAVASSLWNSIFVDQIKTQESSLGGRSLMLADDTHPTHVPWIGIDRIVARFTAPAQVSQGDLTLAGNGATNYAITGFDYNAASMTATWMLGTPITTDNLIVILSDNIKTTAGVRLDGDANGADGASFYRRFNVLPGDANGDGLVNQVDIDLVTASVGAPSVPGAPVSHDLNGSNAVDSADLAIVNARLGATQPAASPPLLVMPGDFDRDGSVGLRDLLRLRDHFDQRGQLALDGDMNGDGLVNQADAALFISRLANRSVAPPAAIVVSVSPSRGNATDHIIATGHATAAMRRTTAANRSLVTGDGSNSAQQHDTLSTSATAARSTTRRLSRSAASTAHDAALSIWE